MSIVLAVARLDLPRVEESLSPVEVYIDGAVFSVTGGVAHAIGYVERRRGDEIACYEAVRVHMPVEGMIASMLRAQAVFMGGGGAH